MYPSTVQLPFDELPFVFFDFQDTSVKEEAITVAALYSNVVSAVGQIGEMVRGKNA